MQEKWRFFKKNRPLYAGIGIFREGGHRRETARSRMTSGTMDDEDAGIQCREMDIRRGRMTAGTMDDEDAQKRNRLNVKRNKVNVKRNR